VYARNGTPGFPGSRAVARASYAALDILRRPRVIDYSKAQGLSLQASIHIYTAPVESTGAFYIWAGTEVKTSAGRNYFGRPITIFGTKGRVYSLRGEKLSFVPTFSAERKSCLCGEKQTLLRQTFSGTGTEAKTSAGRNYFGRSLTIFGTKERVYSLRGEKLSFIPTFSAERKSCLCGEKQTLLRQTFSGQAQDGPAGVPVAIKLDSTKEKENTMVPSKLINLMLSCALACLLLCGPALASTLSTNFAEVNVDNLKIGGVYNLSETARYPMWVGYSGDVPVDLKFESVTPGAAELKSGFEAVPDVSWISFSRKSASLLPDETVTVDVTITVPNDEKYLGKKYQAYVLISSVAPKDGGTGMTFLLALKGRVLFTIAPKAPTQAELREISRNRARGEAQGLIITPERFAVSASSTDTKLVITQDVPLKLINPSTENVKIFIEAVDPQPNGISVPRGYATGDLKSIEISKQRFTLKKDGIVSLEMKADVKGKAAAKLFYAIKVFIKTETLEVVRFVKVYIN